MKLLCAFKKSQRESQACTNSPCSACRHGGPCTLCCGILGPDAIRIPFQSFAVSCQQRVNHNDPPNDFSLCFIAPYDRPVHQTRNNMAWRVWGKEGVGGKITSIVFVFNLVQLFKNNSLLRLLQVVVVRKQAPDSETSRVIAK